MSIAGGVPLAVDRAARVGATALQIFTRNQLQWSAPELSEEEVQRFRVAVKQSPLRYVCAHASYLINIASPDPPLRARSESALVAELRRAEDLGCHCLVLHPGSPRSDTREAGVARVAESVMRVLAETRDCTVRLALENTSGQGTVLGSTVSELGDMVDACSRPARLGVCIDTCHAFASGHDLREKQAVVDLVAELGDRIGLERLWVLHLNDSLYGLGSHRDRHTHIGQGHIGAPGFRNLLTNEELVEVPGILETPKDRKTLVEDRRNLRRLRRLH